MASIELPAWAQVREKRIAHIERVTTLLEEWARTMNVEASERLAWTDAGRLHDALRDAPDDDLRRLAPDPTLPTPVLHGPAAAALLEGEGESRAELLDAIRHHTIGSMTWGRLGRALYMADYLEPGRPFAQAERRFLAAHVPHDFDGVFREVVRHRLAWTIREGKGLFDGTVRLWNAIR